MIKQRLSFTNAHCNWTSKDWCKVLFSDQSSAQQLSVRMKQRAGCLATLWKTAPQGIHQSYSETPPNSDGFGGYISWWYYGYTHFDSWNDPK